jgi:hypothetical protein
MQANELMVWLLMTGLLAAILAGGPVWLPLMRMRFSRYALGNFCLALGGLLALGTLGGLRAVAQDAAPLQVPLTTPDSSVVFSDKRPDWVEAKPVLDGDVHSLAVKSDFHVREAECWRALDRELMMGTKAYIAEYLGSNHAPLFFSYTLDEIKARFLRSDSVYHEVVEVSFGPMHQVHALLEFPADFRRDLDQHWAQVVAAGRLVKTAGSALGILALVTIIFGYFRLDTATRGYYTRRLQFVAAAAILALIAAGVVFARSNMIWVQWLLM